jgi:hypothetical protein
LLTARRHSSGCGNGESPTCRGRAFNRTKLLTLDPGRQPASGAPAFEGIPSSTQFMPGFFA